MFSPETLDFIAENHWMNSREWFAEHKKEYTKFVRNPLIELSDALAETVLEIDPQIVTDPRASVSRINRDMRFSKTVLYRDTVWVSLKRDRKAFQSWPEFFVVISPNEFFYGCGYYCIKPAVMNEIRKMVLEDHPKFRLAKTSLDSQNIFTLEGEMYKRSKYPDHPEALKMWLDRKTPLFMYRPKNGAELFEADLAEKIKNTFVEMRPIYEFLVLAEEKTAQAE